MKIQCNQLKCTFVGIYALVERRASLIGGKGQGSNWAATIVNRNRETRSNPKLRRFSNSSGGGQPAPRSDHVWESSRFALDLHPDAPKAAGGLAAATYELFAGMIEFGLSIRLAEIVTVTDTRMERILRRAGWPLRPIGKPRPLGNTIAVAGYLEVSTDALVRIRSAGRISCPVLWAPVMRAAA